jgi:diguanylate cyclase (GGDEF)-like protein
MESKIGLIIQFTGIFLITVLSLFLRRSLKTAALTYWTIAWGSLSFSLSCLSFAFNFEQFTKPLFGLYFFGEYVFALMLIFGCRSLAENYQIKPGAYLILLPFTLVSFGLPFLANDFNLVFNFHAFLLATFFAAAFFALQSSKIKSFGWRVMRVALALLALDFYHYGAVFTLLNLKVSLPFSGAYLAFNPIIDLVLEILLGFGMIIVLLERVLQEVQEVNGKLKQVHEKLEEIAHIDSLTTAFNRHAFYGYLSKRGEDGRAVSGCVGFFDIDDLKPINDLFGHAVGDMAIRAVVRAIRALVRAEDLIFRWGGDEFFVIMVGMDAEMARRRMDELEKMLTEVSLEETDQILTIRVSFGFTDFAEASELERAVKLADEEMYRRKQERKGLAPPPLPTIFASKEKATSSLNLRKPF